MEIGVQHGHNIAKVEAPVKIGVDPDHRANATVKLTSDDYFKLTTETFDLIFIDGLHHSDQVRKDFDNSLLHLRKGGIIVLHDTCPESEDLTSVPRIKSGRWLGDVYKFICELNEYDGIDFRTLDSDNGITIVWRDEKKGFDVPAITWEYFERNRHLLRVAEFYEIIHLLTIKKQPK